MIYVRCFDGKILPARCRMCQKCMRNIRATVHYLGSCYDHIDAKGEKVGIKTCNINAFACKKFVPQPSFVIYQQQDQLQLFNL